MKMIKCVAPKLMLMAHQTTLHMVKESIHNNRYDFLFWSNNYVTSLCKKQAAGSRLVFEETDHAEQVQTLCWSQNMVSDCGWDWASIIIIQDI
jgi:hypothetical protein